MFFLVVSCVALFACVVLVLCVYMYLLIELVFMSVVCDV